MSVTKTSTSSELTTAHELHAAPEEHLTLFQERFSRCYRLLHFIACRVLGGPEQATEAVENCWLRAVRKPSHFEYEGAFRSWLLRVLIDEALAIRREHQETSKPKVSRERRRRIPQVNYQTAG
jgi:DNA-directed RNA polymerase specialized sigma24 family protein